MRKNDLPVLHEIVNMLKVAELLVPIPSARDVTSEGHAQN